MAQFSLPKIERLKSTKVIQRLFTEGKALSAYPIRAVYLFLDQSSDQRESAQFAFSVGKRKFPKAVDRNRIKRQMREAFRTQKPTLLSHIPTNKKLAVLFLYVGKEAIPYARMHSAMGKALQKLSKETRKNESSDQPMP